MNEPTLPSPHLEIIGRTSSHFTRVATLIAHELGVPFTLIPVRDLMSSAPATFAGNPALKIPVLRITAPDATGTAAHSTLLFGVTNIARKLVELATESTEANAASQSALAPITWPESLRDDLTRNAHELVSHGMSAQVQLVVACRGLAPESDTVPRDEVYLAKVRGGLEGSLAWLDAHLVDLLARLPTRRTSLFEVMLFCLVEHIAFRATLPLAPYAQLSRFAADFARRPAAEQTRYRQPKAPA